MLPSFHLPTSSQLTKTAMCAQVVDEFCGSHRALCRFRRSLCARSRMLRVGGSARGDRNTNRAKILVRSSRWQLPSSPTSLLAALDLVPTHGVWRPCLFRQFTYATNSPVPLLLTLRPRHGRASARPIRRRVRFYASCEQLRLARRPPRNAACGGATTRSSRA